MRQYLGTRVLYNVQRQLMLDTTSRYWVEHLTAIEVLRQGVGLQSYAQKDPLAEYRVRAYEMFQELLRAIQADVVTGMFTYRPRDLSQVRVGVERRKRPPSRAGATPSQGQRRKQRPKNPKTPPEAQAALKLRRLHAQAGYGTIPAPPRNACTFERARDHLARSEGGERIWLPTQTGQPT